MGYLPEAMINYLARLGWSHGDDELFSREQMVEWFSLEGLNKGAARFDFVKLENVNGHYIREAKPERLYEVMVATAAEVDRPVDFRGLTENRETVLAALPELQPRAKTVLELIDLAQFIYATRPIAVDAAAAEQLTADARGNIFDFAEILRGLNDWSVAAIDGGAGLCRGQGLKSASGAAFARRADRTHRFAGHFRSHGADRKR